MDLSSVGNSALTMKAGDPVRSYRLPSGETFSLPVNIVEFVVRVEQGTVSQPDECPEEPVWPKTPRQKALDYLADVVSGEGEPMHQRIEAARLILQYGALT